MTAFRILVTGSRETTAADIALVESVLQRTCRLLTAGRGVIIVQGECPYGGVDLAAKRWAQRTAGATSEGWPAQWAAHGKAAGPMRNAHMVSLGADLCLAFPSVTSTGTWDCLRKAADAGIPGRVYPLGGAS